MCVCVCVCACVCAERERARMCVYVKERESCTDSHIQHTTPTRHTYRPSVHTLTCSFFCLNILVLTGKGHTLTWLHSQGIFPLDAFVRVSESLTALILIFTDTDTSIDTNS